MSSCILVVEKRIIVIQFKYFEKLRKSTCSLSKIYTTNYRDFSLDVLVQTELFLVICCSPLSIILTFTESILTSRVRHTKK